MFHMSNDSGLFRDARRRGELAVPVRLYEAKLVHQFDHRWATYVGDGDESRDMTDAEKVDASKGVQPRYWLDESEGIDRLNSRSLPLQWAIGYRDICRNTDMRTLISAAIPTMAVDGGFPLLFPLAQSNLRGTSCALLIGNFNALVCDYVVRQKATGAHLKYFHVRQLPVLRYDGYSDDEQLAIVSRVLELSYTANDMHSFYAGVTSENPAFDSH